MPATPYLTFDAFRTAGGMPAEAVDELDEREPGFILRRLEIVSARINAKLAKRYVVPFSSPYPDVVCGWLADIVTADAYARRGFNIGSERDQDIRDRAAQAWKEVEEAANATDGLFELPLRQDLPSSSAATLGGPYGYSEASPYVAHSIQAARARDEDAQGSGS